MSLESTSSLTSSARHVLICIFLIHLFPDHLTSRPCSKSTMVFWVGTFYHGTMYHGIPYFYHGIPWYLCTMVKTTDPNYHGSRLWYTMVHCTMVYHGIPWYAVPRYTMVCCTVVYHGILRRYFLPWYTVPWYTNCYKYLKRRTNSSTGILHIYFILYIVTMCSQGYKVQCLIGLLSAIFSKFAPTY